MRDFNKNWKCLIMNRLVHLISSLTYENSKIPQVLKRKVFNYKLRHQHIRKRTKLIQNKTERTHQFPFLPAILKPDFNYVEASSLTPILYILCSNPISIYSYPTYCCVVFNYVEASSLTSIIYYTIKSIKIE